MSIYRRLSLICHAEDDAVGLPDSRLRNGKLSSLITGNSVGNIDLVMSFMTRKIMNEPGMLCYRRVPATRWYPLAGSGTWEEINFLGPP
jgi:hypothetical protein